MKFKVSIEYAAPDDGSRPMPHQFEVPLNELDTRNYIERLWAALKRAEQPVNTIAMMDADANKIVDVFEGTAWDSQRDPYPWCEPCQSWHGPEAHCFSKVAARLRLARAE